MPAPSAPTSRTCRPGSAVRASTSIVRRPNGRGHGRSIEKPTGATAPHTSRNLERRSCRAGRSWRTSSDSMLVSATDSLPAVESHRVTRRFAVTFVANGVRMALSLLTWLLIARGLGASGYGDLTFLLGSFAAINLMLDFGSQHAFHTLVSARPRGPLFFGVYLVWTLVVQWGLTATVIAFALPAPLFQGIWLGHPRASVLLALTATFLTSQVWAMV